MAMNKTERVALADAQRNARVFRALRWSPEQSITPDMEVPRGGERIEGWGYNAHTGTVERKWTTSVSHGTVPHYGSGSQQGIRMYSSRTLALRAMRCELERRAAEQLARIDEQIEAGE